MKILIVDDEKLKRLTLRDDLLEANYDVVSVDSPLTGLQLLQNEVFDVLITDLRMPGMSGVELLKHAKERYPHITVIIMTAYANIETAIEAMKFGAYDYIEKPFLSEELILMLDRLKAFRAKGKAENARESEPNSEMLGAGQLSFYRFIGKNSQIREIMDMLPTVVESDSNVMLYGELGSGTILLAKTIHLQSHRRYRPFISLNCRNFSAQQLSQKLFGDATSQGQFKLAAGGTLCLNNIETMPLSVQAELMHRIWDQSEAPETSDTAFRLIGTVRTDLKQRMKDGAFLPELYYHMNVISLFLPPIRERKSDIPILINHFLEFFSPHRVIGVQPEAMKCLVAYPWPGNLAEMKNTIEKLVTISQGSEIREEDIPLEVRMPSEHRLGEAPREVNFHEVMKSTERELIVWAMQRAKGNKSQAARLLSMKPATFRDALARHYEDSDEHHTETALPPNGNSPQS